MSRFNPVRLFAPSRRDWLVLSALSAAALAGCGGGDTAPTIAVGNYLATPLVSNTTATAKTDANLVDVRGVTFNPTGLVWVNNAGTATSTLYDGNGTPNALVVAVPSGSAAKSKPTGIVFSGSATDFSVSNGTVSAASRFIFATEDGTISAWAPTVNRTNAILSVNNSSKGSAYLGLAVATDAAGAGRLYAADFKNGRIDAFDAKFAPVTLSASFGDTLRPSAYKPFNIQQIGGKLYVAYARPDASGLKPLNEAGNGQVSVFDTEGRLIKHLVSAGAQLNSPWGMTMAPANFGTLSGSLLVGSVADGVIHAYDPSTGGYRGSLGKADGSLLRIEGLWGFAFGNGVQNQAINQLFYASSTGGGTGGAYGRIEAK